MHNQHEYTNRAEHNRCRELTRFEDFTRTPLRTVGSFWRPFHLVYAKDRHRRAQHRSSHCISASVAAWANSWAARCVSSKEGGIASNTGNGYYGKWQADPSFASAYNPDEARTFGPYAYAHGGAWPEEEQDVMAYNGWRARGWSPWPNTAAACGLL